MSTPIEELNNRVIKAREAYYGGGQPIMSDAEYDVLEAQLKGLVAAQPQLSLFASALQTVGQAKPTSGRIKHDRPMLSIENYYTIPEVIEWAKKIVVAAGVPVEFCIEPKRDGISCEIKYDEKGILYQALTRGDGEAGEAITPQVRACKRIPSATMLKNIAVRGELVMRKTTLDRINAELLAANKKPYASTRNLTAGTMKQQDLAIVASRDIEFMAWDVSGLKTHSDGNYDRMTILGQHGFGHYEGLIVSSPDAIAGAIDTILKLNDKSDIIADGVVIKVDPIALRRKLGAGSTYTNFQICFKAQNAATTTYLREVDWQVGRQGKLTPVAICDPVTLAGAVITKANLNNISWIDGMGLKIGAKVEILRSGDVIPQIIKVVDATGTAIEAPLFCPACAARITVHTDDSSKITTHWCENPACPAQLAEHLSFIAGRTILEIDSLGPEMAGMLVKRRWALTTADLFEFGNTGLRGIEKYGEAGFIEYLNKKGVSGITIVKMVRSLETAKTANWDRWIAALGIPMVSLSLGKQFAETLRLGSDDMKDLGEHLLSVTSTTSGITYEAFGPKKKAMLKEWLDEPFNQDQMRRLHAAGVRPTPMIKAVVSGNQPLAGVAFVISGEFAEGREGLVKKLKSLGAVEKSSVSAKVTHLIAGAKAGASKLKDAVKHGVKQYDETWLAATLKDNGLTYEGGGQAAIFDPEVN
jgi:DNA ligase (NAD+)